jgi:protocatechuate 3,4-dioxygenase beta subunit
MTEGPYFKAGSPERADLSQGLPGTKLTLTGYVLTADCQPVPGALVDFWQADSQGQYDNSGYTLRGHQQTDSSGRYQLITVVPGLYPGRTEHIHVKVQAPGGPVLTTQLFFPGVAQNQQDSIFDQSLLINVQSTGAAMAATYNFIIATK